MPTHIFTDEEKENLREQMLEAGFLVENIIR